ncbi:hypothetical protein ABZ439_10620 [Streptomyces sp. NPDC005840]|jgi:hypothetical protein|uniref:hypothetical protein n=1 Tax=unclassified Streptomyces TaxID=2593676 RepID=UPI0033D4144D
MARRPSRPARVLATAVAAGALLTTAACSDGGSRSSGTAAAAATPLAADSASPSPSASPMTSPPGRLTRAGARTALITEGDIEDDWTQVKSAGRWRETLLVGKVDVADFLTAKTDAADCQKLMDSLYGDALLGRTAGPSALTGFQDGDSRLLYQVAAYTPKQLDTALASLRTLPAKCASFTATGKGGKRAVRVTEQSVPNEGDARQGLRVTVQGAMGGSPTTLTLDVAVVRVGDDAITVTAGGLSGGRPDAVTDAVEQGTQRLKDVLAGKTPAPNPGQFD